VGPGTSVDFIVGLGSAGRRGLSRQGQIGTVTLVARGE
jgi:hypothetical protein